MSSIHTLVWYLEGSSRLSSTAARVLSDPWGAFHVPTIVLAEVRHLADARRLSLPFEDIRASVQRDWRMAIDAFDSDILELMPAGLEIHDAIICATAIFYREFQEEVAVLTKDRGIRAAGVW